MIDERITLEKFGYISDELSPGSHKKVWSICETCGEGREKERRDADQKCRRCDLKNRGGKNNSNWQGGDIGRVCAWCGNIFEFKRQGTQIKKFCDTKCQKKYTKVFRSGENHPGYRIPRTDETKQKIRDSMPDMRMHNSPCWRGGISTFRDNLKHSSAYKNWYKAVFERDDYTCQTCMTRGGHLHAHHIRPVRDNKNTLLLLDIDNGVTLCKECHRETFCKEYDFVNFFDYVVKNGY